MGRPKREDVERERDQPSAVSQAYTDALTPHLDILARRDHRKNFTDEEEAAIVAILAVYDGNVSRTGDLTKLSKGTIWQVKERNIGAFTEARERFKRNFVVRLQDISHVLSERLVDKAQNDDFSFRDGMVGLGIAIDKAAMLAGEGTQVNVNVTHRVDPLAVAAVADRLREIMGGRQDAIEAEFVVLDEDA